MKATLELEFIGANIADDLAGMSRMLDAAIPGIGRATVGSGYPRPWVAEVTGTYPSGKLVRSFVRSNRDYSRANSKGSRGVYLWFILETDRLYEVSARSSWKSNERYFCAVTQCGDIKTLIDEEVKEWLSGL